MQFHLKKVALLLGLYTVATCVLAQQSSNVLQAATKPTAKPGAQGSKQSLFKAQHFDQAAISPDGKRVAWVEIRADVEGAPTGKQDIFVQEVSTSGKLMRVTAGAPTGHFSEGNIAWSPDSRRIAFISDAVKSGQPQLYVISTSGGPARKLTSVKGFLAGPQWSPDGKSIGVLFTENATRGAGPLVAETPETGEIKDSFFEQRLAIVDVATAKLRQVTPADTYIYEYDWAPDGKSVVLTAAKGNGDSNWYIAELFAVNISTAEMQPLYKPKLQIARPAVSPDGQGIAFIEGLMSDEDSVGGDVFLISRSGGVPRNLTPERKASAVVAAWTSDGKIIDMENVDGQSSVASIDPESGQINSLYLAPELLTTGFWSTSLSLTPDGKTAAFLRSSFQDPPEVWAGLFGAWKQITHRNEGIKPEWGEAKSLHWSNDGFDVQGWLIYPKSFDASKTYPFVVSVHGGPGMGIQPNWPSNHAYGMALPAHGYFLFLPNPRGSFGQGEAFTRANVKDFGYGDWRDIMAGVEEAIRVAPIDPQRLGLTGWSYGGYMTMWGVTQTNRFRAAMAGAGIANWSSYYGENKIDQWMIPFFGKSVYDDPEVYARSAPLTFIKKVKTPTLVIVGDSDGECPTPQSYEFWHALKTLGVKTQLVVYEHEGHMFVKPEHQRDVIARTVAWFDEYLK